MHIPQSISISWIAEDGTTDGIEFLLPKEPRDDDPRLIAIPEDRESCEREWKELNEDPAAYIMKVLPEYGEEAARRWVARNTSRIKGANKE